MFRIAQRLPPLFWRYYQPTPAPIDQPPDENAPAACDFIVMDDVRFGSYAKLAANYLAFVKLASIRIWLRTNESTP
jgi:hypothetical protein